MMVTIHRDHTFEYRGDTYACVRLGPAWSGDNMWEVYRVSDSKTVGEFQYLDEIREFVNKSEANDWDLSRSHTTTSE